jgi:hypothetical protein
MRYRVSQNVELPVVREPTMIGSVRPQIQTRGKTYSVSATRIDQVSEEREKVLCKKIKDEMVTYGIERYRNQGLQLG